MDNITNIGFVDTKPKSVGGRHYPNVVKKKTFLGFASFGLGQTGMVPSDSISFLPEIIIQSVHLFSGGCVNNSRLLLVVRQVTGDIIPRSEEHTPELQS